MRIAHFDRRNLCGFCSKCVCMAIHFELPLEYIKYNVDRMFDPFIMRPCYFRTNKSLFRFRVEMILLIIHSASFCSLVVQRE